MPLRNDALDIVGDDHAHYQGTTGNHVTFYQDASVDERGTQGAFADIAAAIGQAENFIFMVDWSFHPDLTLQRRTSDEISVGRMLVDRALRFPDLLIAILPWNHVAGGRVTGDAENNAGEDYLRRLNGGRLPANLLFQLAKCHAWSEARYSHHQKFIVLDAPGDQPDDPRRVKVFFGGLDLTRGRFDWQEHPILHGRSATFLDDWYNGEFSHALQHNREPWHDIHAQAVGPVAWDFIYEFTARWIAAADDDTKRLRVMQRLADLLGPDASVLSQERNVVATPGQSWRAQVLLSKSTSNILPARQVQDLVRRLTGAQDDVRQRIVERMTWGMDVERSIQDAYLEMIAAADQFIYIESQYLISSGEEWDRPSVANAIASALVERIREKIRAGREFHVYIVLPMYPEGDPSSNGTYAVRYLQWRTMAYMAEAVDQAIGHDDPREWTNFLSFHCLANWSNSFADGDVPIDPHTGRPDWTRYQLYPPTVTARDDRLAIARRYMVYVHSKAMIVDDRYAIIGSANLNERSLAGNRDTEIAVAIWSDAVDAPDLKDFRKRLWTEHFGPGWMTQTTFGVPNGDLEPHTTQCVDVVLGAGLNNFIAFMKGERTPEMQGHLINFPFTIVNRRLDFDPAIIGQVPNDCIPDYPESDRANWRWAAGPSLLDRMWRAGDIPE